MNDKTSFILPTKKIIKHFRQKMIGMCDQGYELDTILDEAVGIASKSRNEHIINYLINDIVESSHYVEDTDKEVFRVAFTQIVFDLNALFSHFKLFNETDVVTRSFFRMVGDDIMIKHLGT